MSDPAILQVAVVGLMAAGLLLYRLPGACKCEKCGFHVNEARVERMRKMEQQHADAHRFAGTDCNDPSCDLNRKR